MKDAPRLRRRPRTSSTLCGRVLQHRGCRLGFLVGFSVGVAMVLGLAAPPASVGLFALGSENSPVAVKPATTLP